MIQYEDFSIRIESKQGDRYPVRVLRSPAGEGGSEFKPTFNLDELGDLLVVLGQTVRGTGVRDAARVVTPRTQPKAFGHQLYNALFSGSARSLLDSSRGMLHGKDRGLRIKLHIDPEDPGLAPLASLPWELLYRKKTRDFLSLSHSTPVVRYLDVERPHTPLALEPPLHILVVVSSPAGYQKLDLNRERALIEQSWAQRAAVEVEFTEKATIGALQDQLATRDVHVLHFMGHGDFDERAGQGVLLMEDSQGCGDMVDGHALGVLLHDARTLRLVVLNACETGRVTAHQGLDPFAGIATALVLAGIPAVVAMQFPISDGAAITFAERFYPLLASGRPVDYAVTEARKAIYVAEPGTLEWATPVLFMRSPQGVLFEVSEAERPQVPSARPPSPSFESDLQPERVLVGEAGQVTVQNLGDRAETFQLSWQDPAQDLVFEPARTELPVAQGESATIPFRAAPRRRRWIGGEKAHPFTAQVTSSARETQTHAGEVATTGLVPIWVPPLVIAALAVLSLLLYVLGALNPGAPPAAATQTAETAIARAATQTTEATAETATAQAVMRMTETVDAQAATQTAEATAETAAAQAVMRMTEAANAQAATQAAEATAETAAAQAVMRMTEAAETVPPADGLFSDPDVWDKPSHYSTIHSGDIDGDGIDELLGRGADGMQAWRFNEGSWALVASGGPCADGPVWNDEKYYATIHAADIDGDGIDELLGRGVDGMQAWRFNGTSWDRLASAGPFEDGSLWEEKKYYATIQSGDIDGDGRDELLGRDRDGMQVWRFDGTQWSEIQTPTVSESSGYHLWPDRLRWDRRQYYATIHAGDIDGDGVEELLGRAIAGVDAWRFNEGSWTWDLVVGGGPFADGSEVAWDADPQYYTTIHCGDIDGDGVDELLGRSPMGMEAYRFNGTDWELVPSIGPFKDGPVWSEPRHYATIHCGDIDGDGVDELLGRGPKGMEAYRYGWAPVVTGSW